MKWVREKMGSMVRVQPPAVEGAELGNTSSEAAGKANLSSGSKETMPRTVIPQPGQTLSY
jgi:hypothetical protein